MLRTGVLVAAAVSAVAGLLLWRFHGVLGVWLVVEGGVVACAVLLERGRYRGRGPRDSGGPWVPSNEVFIDPGTGKKMRVLYEKGTGRRRYEPEP